LSLTVYILKLVGLRILASGAIVLAVLQILDLLDVTPDIVERGLGAAGMVQYVLLRLPRLIDQAAPLSVLAGGIFAFVKLAGESEFVAMRASGVSIYRLVAMALPAAGMVAVLHVAAVELVAPRTDPALEAWWRATAPGGPPEASGTKSLRVGEDIYLVATDDPSGRTLSKMRIYRRDTDGRLIERIESTGAEYGPEGWRLRNASFVRFTAGEARSGLAGELILARAFAPADVRALFFGDQIASSAASAGRALTGGGAQRPASYYATRLQTAITGPVSDLLMLLIAAPIALASFRGGQGATFATLSLGAGLLYLVVDGLLIALGESGAVSAGLAAWTAPVIFGTLAATVLLKLEG